MKNIKLFIGVILIISCFACNEKNEVPLSPEELKVQYDEFKKEILSEPSDAKITLERTACFGTCPIYSVAISIDGKVEYFGYKFVEKSGFYKSEIPRNSVIDLLTYAANNGYNNLNEEYYTKIDTTDDGEIIEMSVSDLSSKITSIEIEGERKVVKNYFAGPNWLSVFEAKIDSTISVAKWVGK